jgi:hypothetical protein
MGKPRAVIYHFTNVSKIRPIVYKKEVQRIRRFAEQKGYMDPDEYIDKSLKKRERQQFDAMMANIDNYEAIIMKDFYHLSKATGACLSNLVYLNSIGVSVYTIEDGSFTFTEPPLSQRLRVAVYYCGLEIVGHSYGLQFEIMDLFVRSKTNWTVIDHYADLSGNKVDGSQTALRELIRNTDKYDLVMVQSFGDIHWRTAKFCKMRHLLQKDIYSMQENIFLPYRKEEIKDEV